jgi:general secretion pathway protein G
MIGAECAARMPRKTWRVRGFADRTKARAAGQGRTVCGFTLIELLVTVTIVAILSSVALPMAEMAVKRSKEQELRAALREIRTAIDAYKQAVDEGRITKTLTGTGYPETLDVLVEGAVDAKSPGRDKIYFLRRVPRDPFHTDPAASAAETWGKRAYASPPDDPREGEDVYDVYSLTEDTGINGIPYRQW